MDVWDGLLIVIGLFLIWRAATDNTRTPQQQQFDYLVGGTGLGLAALKAYMERGRF